MNVQYALNLSERLENKLGFDLGFRTIYLRSSWVDSMFSPRTLRISLCGHLKNRVEFKTHLYHEIFHAVFYEYRNDLPKSLIKPFITKNPKRLTNKKICDLEESDGPIPYGYISFYSLKNFEEDMAEIWSCLILNNFKTWGYVEFEGKKFNLEKDLKLKKKFKAMKQIIYYLRDLFS